MKDRRTIVVTAYGHDKTVDKISVGRLENDDTSMFPYKFSSDAKAYCDTINSLTLDGDSWVFAKILSENIQYPLHDLFPLKFDVLLKMNDKDVQKVLMEINFRDIALAIKDESEIIKNKIFKNISKGSAQMLKDDIKIMESMRTEDVTVAQNRIVSMIRRLEESGEIAINNRESAE